MSTHSISVHFGASRGLDLDAKVGLSKSSLTRVFNLSEETLRPTAALR
jgi:hypothetical protein